MCLHTPEFILRCYQFVYSISFLIILQTSLTAAGCYLCAAPRSKGTKLLVCCSVNSPLPSKMELFYRHCYETHKHYIPSEVEQIIVDGKANSDNLVPDASDVQFLDVASSESILVEAKRRNILSESTYSNILSLQEDETKHFKSKTKTISDHDLKMRGVHTVSTSLSLPLQPGQICYFMNRFLVSWNLSNKISGDKSPVEEASCNRDLAGKSLHHYCRHCMVGHDMVAEVRHMVDADWLYLAKLSKHQNLENCEKETVILASAMEQITEKTILCSDYARLSAERALQSLKSIPVAARRSLPVLINSHGRLLSIPVCHSLFICSLMNTIDLKLLYLTTCRARDALASPTTLLNYSYKGVILTDKLHMSK